MQETNLEEKLEPLLARDQRYHRDGYLFVRDALEFTRKQTIKADPDRKHVTGQELLEGIRQYALTEFGPMAITVFEEWGIRQCPDFGEIVFNLVEVGEFSTTEQDSRADFVGPYDFEEAFRKPFLPADKQAIKPAEAKPASA